MGRGRPKLTGVARSKSGKSLGHADQIHPETMAVRERQLLEAGIILTFNKMEMGREILKRTADDRLSGFTLGQLLLRYRQDKSNPGGISETQFEAGEAWGRLVREHAALHGYKISIRTPSFVMASFGQSNNTDDDEKITRIRQQWTECYNALSACGLAVRNMVYGVVVEDWPIIALTDEDYGTLREGLNAIARVLR